MGMQTSVLLRFFEVIVKLGMFLLHKKTVLNNAIFPDVSSVHHDLTFIRSSADIVALCPVPDLLW
jgi:hypothetical protein